jgi:ribonuclease-3
VSDVAALASLIEELPEELARSAVTHSSWVEHRSEAYGRLAFLGDAVLGLAIADELFRRFPRGDAGRLTKVHAQTVSGQACAEVAVALDLPGRLRAQEPRAEDGISPDELVTSQRALASVTEAMIGACYQHHGLEPTAAAVVSAFASRIELASDTLLDFKSALQEELARRGEVVGYQVVGEEGAPHERQFEVTATVNGEVLGRGSGRSKKDAEQAAARLALERVRA